jgi:hypothetical protein
VATGGAPVVILAREQVSAEAVALESWSPLAIGMSLPTIASVSFKEGEQSLVDLRSETVG